MACPGERSRRGNAPVGKLLRSHRVYPRGLSIDKGEQNTRFGVAPAAISAVSLPARNERLFVTMSSGLSPP